jgi:hypothetical protein
MGLEYPMRAAFILPGYFEVEEQIKAAVGTHIPIISISNPSPTIARVADIPKLEVNNDLWESALQVLIHTANLIIMMLDKVTPGVSRELEAIINQQRQESTVLIVSSSVEAELPFVAELRKAQLAGGAEPEVPGTPRFALVISSSDLPAKDGEALPEIVKLIDRLSLAASAGATSGVDD